MFANRISRKLHDEHRTTIELMERLERLIKKKQPAIASDAETTRLLRDLVAAIENDTMRHFDFEENHLFPIFQSVGDQLIADHLTEEHTTIRPVGSKLVTLARAAQQNGFDTMRWKEFQRTSTDYFSRMLLHVQKEEMALLPLIDDIMDRDTETQMKKIYGIND
jgi:hemerythrin-like domain-containing protein